MSGSIWPQPRTQSPRRSEPARAQGPDLLELLNHLDLMTQAVASLRALADKASEARKELEKSTQGLTQAAEAALSNPMKALETQVSALQAAAGAEAMNTQKTRELLTEVNGMADSLKTSLDKMVTQLTETLKANAEALKTAGLAPAASTALMPAASWTRLQLVVTGRDYREQIETVELVKVQ